MSIENLIKDESLIFLCNILKKYDAEIRIVGGAVRDALLNLNIRDIDLAINIEPDSLCEILKKEKIAFFTPGIEHGTVNVRLNNQIFEITSLRKDIDTDGRHARVEYTDDWKEDASRRDFTINALYCDFYGNIYDYFGGREDLQNKCVKFIGHPKTRIKEDYLRILRFFRFSSNFAIKFDEKALEACKQESENLDLLSGDRIRNELLRIFESKNCFLTLLIMENCKFFEKIFFKEKLNLELFRDFDKQRITLNISGYDYLVLLLAAQENLNFEKIFGKWLFERNVRDFLFKFLQSLKEDFTSVESFAYKFGKEVARLRLIMLNLSKKLSFEILLKELRVLNNYEIPKFPISGFDLQKLGLVQGEKIGYYLKKLEALWQTNSFKLSKQELLEQFRKIRDNEDFV